MRPRPSGSTRAPRSSTAPARRRMNPYDAHALEEAVRLKEGAAGADSRSPRSAWARRGAAHAPQGALAGRRRGAAGDRPGARGRGHRRHRARARRGREARSAPTSCCSASRPRDSDSYVMAAAVAEHLQLPLVTQVARLELTGDGVRAKRQTETGYDVVEAPLPGGHLGLRRDQRAALRVAQGDHGRAQEAAEPDRPRRPRR